MQSLITWGLVLTKDGLDQYQFTNQNLFLPLQTVSALLSLAN